VSEVIIFMHIPKTAGTTLIDVMQWQYGDISKSFASKFVDLSACEHVDKIENCQAVAGHVPYGIHDKFGFDNYQYITLFRHPVERIVSLYNYIIGLTGEGRKWWEERGVYNNISLRDFVNLRLANLHDGMVRQLIGIDFYYENQYRPVNIDDYKLVVKRLDSMLYGTVEDIDKSIKRIGNQLGWKVGKIPHSNKANYDLNLSSSKMYDVYDDICNNNQFDILLYHRAKTRLGKQ